LIDRLGRNLRDLVDIVATLEERDPAADRDRWAVRLWTRVGALGFLGMTVITVAGPQLVVGVLSFQVQAPIALGGLLGPSRIDVADRSPVGR
jgi:hypothetical protein